MFEIIGSEEFKSKYLNRADCAGLDWASDLACGGNIIFIKQVRTDGPIYERFVVSQILYFKMLGTDFIVQDEDFYSFYK